MSEPVTELIPQPLPEDEGTLLPFWEHVGELRDRLVLSAGVLFAGTALAYWKRFALWELAQRPLREVLGPAAAGAFAFTDLSEPFTAMVRLAFWAAVFATSPFLFFQLWAFVRPALRPAERRYATLFVSVTSACFLLGAAFAYFVLFPVLGRLLLAEAAAAGLRAMLRPEPYLNIFLYSVVGVGVCFEAPVLFWFLGRWGLVTVAGMLKWWREAVVGILAASAFLTPGDAVSTTILFGGVLLALYAVSIAVVALSKRRD